MNAQTKLPALVVGGNVNAIVPQSIEEMWRVSTMVVSAGLAPKALVGKKVGNDAASAVAIAVMAGAELGLPPMVALRSFTVIGGRPALYGDGIINVVRRSRKAAYIRTGYEADKGIGWCEAKRSDTGEEKRVEFSVADAKRAGLWDERPTVKKQDWNTKAWTDAPNEAPWFRYPQRMMQWRAAGFCLRELFADVLGGITDEYEAREIAGPEELMRDVSPATPPSPPKAPAATEFEEAEIIEPTEEVSDSETFNLDAFLTELDAAMATGKTEEQIIEIWDGFDVEATLTGDDNAMQRAFDLRTARLVRLSPLNA